MPESVLVVEQDERVAGLIREHLGTAELTATLARSEPEAQALLGESHFALAVVDIDLPGMEAFLASLGHWPPRSMPVLVVSAHASELDRARWLELGADDVLGKPIRPVELVARVCAQLRRASSAAATAPIAVGEISVDPVRREIRRSGRVVPTTWLEFGLVWVLATELGRVFSRNELLRRVWGPARVVEPRAVDNLVARLRQKLEANPHAPRHLVTVWGSGYRFDP